MPIIRRSDCVPLPVVVCPVVATTGQTTIGSGTQSDLLMMGIKMPKHIEILLITNKSLFVVSSWSHLYLLIKDARSFEHKVS